MVVGLNVATKRASCEFCHDKTGIILNYPVRAMLNKIIVRFCNKLAYHFINEKFGNLGMGTKRHYEGDA